MRLEGYDTPERHSRCDSGIEDMTAEAAAAATLAALREEELSKQARQILVDLIRNGSVLELRNVKRDKYFRLLAELWIDGRNVADTLMAANLAVPYHGEKKQGWCDR